MGKARAELGVGTSAAVEGGGGRSAVGGESKAKRAPEGSSDRDAAFVRPVLLDLIEVGAQQLRHDVGDDDIVELAADIASKGLLQPIGVLAVEGGRYQLLWGSRRLVAHQRLRARTILARIYQNADYSVKVIALTENLQRRQLTLAEECDAVHHLYEGEKRSPDQIASLLSKSRAWVNRRLAVPALPDELRVPVLEGSLAVGVAEEIARLDDASARAYLLQHAVSANLTVSQVRGLREAWQASPTTAEAVEAGVAAGAVLQQRHVMLVQCAACGCHEEVTRMVVVRVCQSHLTASGSVELPERTESPVEDRRS